MKLYIESISSWSTSGVIQVSGVEHTHAKASAWPKLEFVPAMQRRRLSPFAKIALYTAEKALSAAPLITTEQVDIVFSSRHGDLHKTAALLTELSENQDISPTAFSTSVHNAVPGLYSILKQNKQAINAISAGQDSFFYALVDAYARLKSGRAQRLLVVHVDRELPELYAEFKDEQQIDHAVAMVLTLEQTSNVQACIDVNFTALEQVVQNSDNGELLNNPAALCFVDWFATKPSIGLKYTSQRHVWTCEHHMLACQVKAGTIDV